MRNSIAACVLVILLLVPASVWASHPFQVEDTNTQGTGNYAFELNGDYTKLRDHYGKTADVAAVLRAGTGDATDVILELPYLMLDPSPVTGLYEKGTGDVLLRLKYRTYENEVKQSAGFQIYANLPTGDARQGLGSDKVFIGVQVMDQQECHNNILHVSLAYEALGGDMTRSHFGDNYALRFGLALERKLTESVRLLSEVAGETRKSKDNPYGTTLFSQPFTFMVGVRRDLSKTWSVDLSGRAGLNHDAEDYTALAGTAWRF